jgi:hypothetical protein
MNKTWLFNPFRYIAGLTSLTIGWAIMLATAGIAWFSKAHFDGVLDLHSGLITPFSWYLLDQLVAWACVVLVFYLAGLILSASTVRFVDIAGTMALARWPVFFAALLNLATTPITDIHNIPATSIIIYLVEALFFIWMVALMYRAFCVSTNLKGSKATVVFVAALLTAEALSKTAFYFLYRHIN